MTDRARTVTRSASRVSFAFAKTRFTVPFSKPASLVRATAAAVSLLAGTTPVFAQAEPPAGLRAATDRLLAEPALRQARIGYAVIDVASGRVVDELDGSRAFVPASLAKVPTTATALAVLGEDHRFVTRLVAEGRVVDGSLRGDLVVVGGGDPSLGAGRPTGALDLGAVLTRWVEAVRRAGIRRIDGSVIGVDALDPGAEPSPYWQWNDIGNYYGAGAGALMIHENFYALQLARTAAEGGRPAIVGTEPEVSGLTWTNDLTSGPSGSGDQSYIFGAPRTYERVIRGTIPAGRGVYRVKGSLPDPALQTAQWLTAAIRSAGIEVAGEPAVRSEPRPGGTPEARELDAYASPPLRELARLTNFRSVNVIAEALYAALAREWLGGADDPEAVGERLAGYWAGRGVRVDGWEQLDGSGLSMRSLTTPRQLARVLALAHDRGFAKLLPRAGAEGTVRSVLRGRPEAKRLRLKSGTLSRSRGFAGYAKTPDGRTLAFAIVANNFDGGRATRRAMTEWLTALVR